MDPGVMRERVRAARVARLATVSADGVPHLVPVCFALVDDVVFTAVDAKPKRRGTLRRVGNLTATGRAALLVDHYAEDWARLWWVRLDARGRVVDEPGARARGLEALVGKYPQYVRQPPAGPVVELSALRWSGWASSDRG